MPRITVLDDEASRRTEIVFLLDGAGYEVQVAGRPRAEELAPGTFDVLVVGVETGLLGARPVVRTLVEERGMREPVVVTCGAAGAHLAARAVREGLAFESLEWPGPKRRALEVIGRAARHAALLRELERTRTVAQDVKEGLCLLGESAAILSHEIRTPLSGLRHALCAVGDSLGIEHRRLLEDHLARLTRIERLAELALSFTRPLSPRRTDCSLAGLLGGAAGRWSATIPVEVDLENGDVVVHADPELFDRVLDNLVRNAVEAGAGRVRITARTQDAGELRLTVEDDGPGIEKHRRHEVFAPFRTSKAGGSGIGLALCRRIVEAHGGELRATEGALGGACLCLRLPRGEAGGDSVVEGASA